MEVPKYGGSIERISSSIQWFWRIWFRASRYVWVIISIENFELPKNTIFWVFLIFKNWSIFEFGWYSAEISSYLKNFAAFENSFELPRYKFFWSFLLFATYRPWSMTFWKKVNHGKIVHLANSRKKFFNNFTMLSKTNKIYIS